MLKAEKVKSQTPTSVNVVMACYNRAPITKRFFDSLKKVRHNGFEFAFAVTNDGSTDETHLVLESQPYPMTTHYGSGDLYWAKSMAKAESLIEQVPDGILWMNDDLVVYPDAFEKLLNSILAYPNAILVGQVKDLDSGRCIYGGYRRTGKHPLVLELLHAENFHQEADTFNGNFVYIPIEIRLAVGAIDSHFEHAYADCDYGYRARKLGYAIQVIPGFIGATDQNLPKWPDGRIRKIKQLIGKKYNPLTSQIRFFFLHRARFGIFKIPIYLLRPFIRILISNSGESRKIS